MDFDEYEYLEKTVENPHLENEVGNGGDQKAKSEGKECSRSSRHRSDEKRDEDEDGRRSKRSRSHHRSHSRDRERDRADRHRSSREHRDKDRDREKDRDKEERNGEEREREKDKNRDIKGRDREKDRERDRSRRSRSRSERHRSQEREKSQEMEPKERDTKERDRARRRHKDKKEDKVEPEADPERDQRTVFAYQIALRATERDVYEFFSRAGKVRDVRIIMDRISRRSRGIGYVEFYDTMSVPMAIALSGQPLLGQPVMVKPSEAEKNLVQSTTAAGGMLAPYSGGARRLYVGNLHVSMSEDDLRKVFEPFGSVELLQIPRDETGLCKGFGFVQFARLEDARNALNLNGQLEIAGRAIKVSAVTDQTEFPEAGQMQTTGDLDDDDDGAGLSLNAQSRALLMQKLDRSGTASSNGLTAAPSVLGAASTISPLVAPFLVQGIIPGMNIPTALDPVGVPSEYLLLKNMFDPSTETEPEFDEDIKDDVKEECSKFGKLIHIYVDKNSVGFVYLRFENVQAAMGAQRALHGRWFAGKMITATYMTKETYEARFPESK